jgi:hypothetical protein
MASTDSTYIGRQWRRVADLALFDSRVAAIACFSLSSDWILANTDAISMLPPPTADDMLCTAWLISPVSVPSANIVYTVYHCYYCATYIP